MEVTVVGKLLTVSILISLLGGCASNQETYISHSVNSSANNSYQPTRSSVDIVSNFLQWRMSKLPHEDQVKQEQAVFFALDNSDEGEVVEWYSDINNSSGKVSIMMSYPQGSGYCRVIFSQINYNNKSRDFKETACRNGSVDWRFIRR